MIRPTVSLVGVLVEAVVVAAALTLSARRVPRRWDAVYILAAGVAGSVYGYLQAPGPSNFPVHSSETSTMFPVWVYLLSFLMCGLAVRITERAGGRMMSQGVAAGLAFVLSNVLLRVVLFTYGI